MSNGESPLSAAAELAQRGDAALAALAREFDRITPPPLSGDTDTLEVQGTIEGEIDDVSLRLKHLSTLLGIGGLSGGDPSEFSVDTVGNFMWRGKIADEERSRLRLRMGATPGGSPYVREGYDFPPMPDDRWHAPPTPFFVDFRWRPQGAIVCVECDLVDVPTEWASKLRDLWVGYFARVSIALQS